MKIRTRAFRALCLAALLSCLFLSGAKASTQIICDCGEADCTCFVQKCDSGLVVKRIMARLEDSGYLKTAQGDVFDEAVWAALCAFQEAHDLPASGMCDDETLTWLVFGLGAEEARASLPDFRSDVVWVPTDGGKKYHRRPGCSGMYDPRKLSRENAIGLGIEACKRCYP